MASADSFDEVPSFNPSQDLDAHRGRARDPYPTADAARHAPDRHRLGGRDQRYVTRLRFTHASEQDKARGLLGFIRLVLFGRVFLDGLTLRHKQGGGYAIAYPRRKTCGDREHHYVHPIDEASQRELDGEILDELRRKGLLP